MSLKDALANVNQPLPENETVEKVEPIIEGTATAMPEEETAVAVVAEDAVTETAVAVVAPATPPAIAKKKPLELLAEAKKEEIRKLNPDFDMDFMNVFTRLKLNTKGRFYYELSGETFELSDAINTKLLAGDYMHQYWGETGSEHENQLVCYSSDGQVTNVDGMSCSECPFGREKCKLRFAVALNLLEEGEEPDEIYNINMPTTGALAFADYVKLLTKKKIPIKEVITQMYTQTKAGKEKGQQFNAILFKLAQ